MSNNYDKIVKLACKPKNAPPKAKVSSLTQYATGTIADTSMSSAYLSDQSNTVLTSSVLVSATYSDDGSLTDIIRALSLRLREPNAVVCTLHALTPGRSDSRSFSKRFSPCIK